MLIVLDSIPSNYLNLFNKQASRGTFQKRLTQMMATVNVMERSYERAPPYWDVEIDGLMTQNGGRSIKIEINGLYYVREVITIAVD